MAVGGEASLIVLDPDLRPEYSHSVTASADMYATAGKVQLNLLVEGFYTSLNDVFTLVEKPADAAGNQVLMRTNADRAEVRGVNIEAKAALDANNSFSLGYTYQRSTYRTPVAWSENEAIPAEKSMLRSPDHYGYVGLNVRPVRNFDISIYGTYTGPMLVPHYMPDSADDVLKRTPSFFDAAVKLSYDIRLTRSITLQVNCGVKNAFDAFQNDVDFGALKDSGYIYGPGAPRMFFVGAKFTM
jgi:outer membrane receptor for ferrienterochelin and colicins